jgi:hypothetical protein
MRAMNDAAIEVRDENPDLLTRCGVSCNGTWQRRGYSSLHGCVTTLSIDTGKCLDVEVLTKVCHGCQRIAREKDASKKADMVEKHSCKMNYKGFSPAMETEGIKRIFARSETTTQLQYTEYFGDGDAKHIRRLSMYMIMFKLKGRNVLVTSKSVSEQLFGS